MRSALTPGRGAQLGPVQDDEPAEFATPRQRDGSTPVALVAGHFSFSTWYATFGDTEAMRVVSTWLDEAGIAHDVACHPANGFRGVDLTAVDPARYDTVVFVCGPWNDDARDVFFKRFEHCTKIGIDVSVVNPDDHGFDHLFARDLRGTHQPDLVFRREPEADLPVAGVFLVHEQPEYGATQRHAVVDEAIGRYLDRGEVVGVPLDTIHVGNRTSTRDVHQLVAVLRRIDLVITSRLHGLVFSLMAGVPTVAIDPVSGGGKVTAQANAVGWPYVIGADEVSPERIAEVVTQCLHDVVPNRASVTAAAASERTTRIKAEFLDAVERSRTGAADSPVR